MTEQSTPPADASSSAAAEGSATGNPPEGFVSRAELEREQTRARTWQAEKDRLEAELARLKTPPKDEAKRDALDGFDPRAFRDELLGSIYKANELSDAARSLRSEFPQADTALTSPARLSSYGSVEALRIAVEADHNRVAAASSASIEAEREKIRAEFAAAYGQEPPPASGAPAGDPTPEFLASMTLTESLEYEKANPGVIERVLRRVA